MNNIKKNMINAFSISFSILFLIIFLNTIFRNNTISIYYKIPTMIIGLLFSYSVIFLIYNKITKINKKMQLGIYAKIFIIFIIITIFVIQLLLAKLVYAHVGWDCGQVVEDSFRLNQGLDIDAWYFSRYTNNMGILLIFKILYSIVGIFYNIKNIQGCFAVDIVFNIIMLDLSAIMTFLTCKKILGRRGYMSLLFIFPLIIFTPYIIIPYTDTISMLFPILIYYIFLLIKEKTKKTYFLIFIEGIITAIGLIIKPTCVIIVIAIIIGQSLYIKFNKENTIKLLKFAVLFVVGFVSIYQIFNIEKKKYITENDYKENSVPFTHFIMMGMQENIIEDETIGKGNILYGVFNERDIQNTSSRKGKEAKINYNISIINERLKNFKFIGYIKFLYNKLIWISCDGTFFYGCEGNFFKEKPYNVTSTGKQIQKIYDINTKEYRNIVANVMQIAWILIQFSLIYTISKNEKINEKMVILKLSIIGIILFVLLFEGRSRYLINYLPIFIVVGTFGLEKSFETVKNIINKIKKEKY